MKSQEHLISPPPNNTTQRPTISHVAQMAGVSRAAVSLVLNNGSIRISEAKRKAIQAAARELGYQPHAGARRLSHGSTETISLIFPYQPLSLSQWFIYELTHHISDQAQRHGYDLLLDLFRASSTPVSRSSPGRVDASIVICDQPAQDAAFLQHWQDTGHPLIVIGGNYLPTPPREFVDVDLTAGTEAATTHLLNEGHRNIAFIAVSPSEEKIAGFNAALTKHGVEALPTVLQVEGDQLRAAFRKLMRHTSKPSAIVAANDAVALRLLKEASLLSLSVPDNLSIVGFDDVEFAALSHPALTTVAFPAKEVATKAVAALIERIRHPQTEPVRVTLTPALTIRESTGPIHEVM